MTPERNDLNGTNFSISEPNDAKFHKRRRKDNPKKIFISENIKGKIFPDSDKKNKEKALISIGYPKISIGIFNSVTYWFRSRPALISGLETNPDSENKIIKTAKISGTTPIFWKLKSIS